MAKMVDEVEIRKVRKTLFALFVVWAVLGFLCVGAEKALSPWRWTFMVLFVCSMPAALGYAIFRWAPAEDDHFEWRIENKRGSQ